MKKIHPYINSQLSEAEDDKITGILLANYYDRKLQKRWEQQLSEKYGLEAPQKTKAKVRSLPKQLIAIAATFLLLAVAYQTYPIFQMPSSQELVAMHLADKYDHPNNRKSFSVDIADTRDKAVEAYVLDDYKKAIYYYQEITTSEESTLEDHFFLSLSYLYAEQPTEAINKFKETLVIPITPSSSIRSKEIIHWYLGLAYIQTGQVELAKIELQTIKGTKKQKAEELLKTL